VTKLETTETVRCLDCAAVYSKPRGGGTISANPGCPHCGYLGWAGAPEPLSATRPRVRFDAGHPRSRFGRPR
jgi:hypothetical protein